MAFARNTDSYRQILNYGSYACEILYGLCICYIYPHVEKKQYEACANI